MNDTYPATDDRVQYLSQPRVTRQVREDRGIYVPDLIADGKHDMEDAHFSAATDYAKHLTEAHGLVGEALNLVRLMSDALCDAGDRRAMQTETACKVIEEKLRKAYNRIDEHDRRHTNLFLAYCDLKNRAGVDAG